MKTTVRSKTDKRNLLSRYSDFTNYRDEMFLGGRGVFYGKHDMSLIFTKGTVR